LTQQTVKSKQEADILCLYDF